MNYIEEINKLQKQMDSNKIEQAKLQEREKTLQEEKEKILKELAIYEIKENDLEGEIIKINEEIEKELNKCKTILGNN
jgi:predicted  nucleic acid-binding Zn-ribbon protein